MKATDIQKTGFVPYYSAYIEAAGVDDLLEALEISLHEFIHFVREVPLGKHDYRYEPGKWTLKDIIQHLIDSERIFAYRALRIGRGDRTPLPGFDEDAFAAASRANERSLQSLLEELSLVRHATLQLFKSFSEEELRLMGIASEREIMCGAIGFVIIGHMRHHQLIFQERYL